MLAKVLNYIANELKQKYFDEVHEHLRIVYNQPHNIHTEGLFDSVDLFSNDNQHMFRIECVGSEYVIYSYEYGLEGTLEDYDIELDDMEGEDDEDDDSE